MLVGGSSSFGLIGRAGYLLLADSGWYIVWTPFRGPDVARHRGAATRLPRKADFRRNKA